MTDDAYRRDTARQYAGTVGNVYGCPSKQLLKAGQLSCSHLSSRVLVLSRSKISHMSAGALPYRYGGVFRLERAEDVLRSVRRTGS